MVDLTIEQLAERVGMSVRNVRAYAGRGLMDPPKLVGRTGFYNQGHVKRLLMIRGLLDRGYTLTAVQEAIERERPLSGHPLELYELLVDPSAPEEPEVVSISELASISGQTYPPEYLQALSDRGLIEVVDDEHVRLLRPVVVRAGAEAISLGFTQPTVLELFPQLLEHLTAVAELLVNAGEHDIWRPFSEAGMPEEGWETLLHRVEAIMPLASRIVVGAFRETLNEVLDQAIEREAERLGMDISSFPGTGVGRISPKSP